jgi:hypothetical protein
MKPYLSTTIERNHQNVKKLFLSVLILQGSKRILIYRHFFNRGGPLEKIAIFITGKYGGVHGDQNEKEFRWFQEARMVGLL